MIWMEGGREGLHYNYELFVNHIQISSFESNVPRHAIYTIRYTTLYSKRF